MINSNQIVLLLTATIKPFNNIIQTKLIDSNLRRDQYIDALNYYLNKTNYSIVFVENSNYDISILFDKYIKQKRLEMIIFEEVEDLSVFGKGYGEMKLIEYGLENSKLINHESVIVKITGRLILMNINKLLIKVINRKVKNNFTSAEFMFNMKTANSRIFIASFNFYFEYLLEFKGKINDTEGYYFEHALGDAIYKSLNNNYQFIHFPIFSEFSGFSGTKNKQYNENILYLNIRSLWCKIKSLKFKLYNNKKKHE